MIDGHCTYCMYVCCICNVCMYNMYVGRVCHHLFFFLIFLFFFIVQYWGKLGLGWMGWDGGIYYNCGEIYLVNLPYLRYCCCCFFETLSRGFFFFFLCFFCFPSFFFFFFFVPSACVRACATGKRWEILSCADRQA